MRYLIALILLIPAVAAQSIGIINAENQIEVYTGQQVATDIRLSQAAGYNELITIKPRENYDWLKVEETEFILEPGVRKIVRLVIETKNNGVYNAEFDICARGAEAGTLSVVACTNYKLVVNSVTNPVNVVVATAATAGSLLFISGLGFFMWRRRARQAL